MDVHSILFAESPPDYARMACALVSSAIDARVPLTMHVIPPGAPFTDRADYVFNARKATAHRKIVDRATDGALLCFLDCDMLILRDLEIELEADLTLTVARHQKPNTGCYFVRVSDRMRDFMSEWATIARALLSVDNRESLVALYGGINQAALGVLLKTSDHISLGYVHASEWNCTNDPLNQYTDSTRIVHLTGPLREVCLGRDTLPELRKACAPILTRWSRYDVAA